MIVHGSWPLGPSGFGSVIRGTDIHVPERSRLLGAHEFDLLIESSDRDEEAETLPEARPRAGSLKCPVGGMRLAQVLSWRCTKHTSGTSPGSAYAMIRW